ncbi:CDP-glycerol glycerophosphotransferase family protein [Staphylococcus xylosus]|uniref:CDP-glycerol glycerophosphotransferase family protein n=1 Tax=Staphylococcus xylosus TaxID=1288 RepID=UPI0009BCA1DA|nr:CDP-glycerol glycerophosphotransferase family protein [Staphylococcus xylosus]
MKKFDVKTKIINYKKNKGKYQYVESRRKKKIQKNQFVLESTHGESVGGHIFYMINEIQKQVPKHQIYIVSKHPERHKLFLEEKGFKNFHIVQHLSEEYYELLAVSEFLINDTTFYPFFSKRREQKYFIIWHGTPLKYMGKHMENVIDVANVQRNFYMADKIIVSNEHTKDILIETHNLKNVYSGKIVVAPSPRNSIFFSTELRKKIRQELDLENKKVICYMPTWRGSIGKVKKSTHVEDMLKYLDEYLDENTVLYVKLHDFEKQEIKRTFNKVKFFPNEYETYEFLTASDGLITDYSSVMFDYLNLKKPIILYAYDIEEYRANRGLYKNIEEYPFYNVSTLDGLEKAIEKLEDEVNYKDLINEYALNDNKLAPNSIVKNILYNYKDENIVEYSIHNGKETVVILSGGFWNNGVTTALINTLENIDTNKRNYICFFEKSKIKKEHYYRLLDLPENVLFYPTTGEMNGNLSDRLLLKKYLWNENFNATGRKKQLRKIFREEFYRLFGDLQVDWFIHYTGFERKEAEMIRHIDAKKAIWVHTDMFEEYKAKKNFNKKIVFGAYKDVDKIVMVHENLRENLNNNITGIKNKLITVNNFLGEKRTRKLGNANLFESLENVKVDYSFNDNAYKSFNQIQLENLKNDLQIIIEEVKDKNNVDYKFVVDGILKVSSKYRTSDYLNHVIDVEEEMIVEAFDSLKSIFDGNDNLIYQLVYKEFINYILPYLKDSERELHFYFPELKEKIAEYINSIDSKVEDSYHFDKLNDIHLTNNEESVKLITRHYQTLKREKDLAFKFNSLFENHIEDIKSYLNNKVINTENQTLKNPISKFFSSFRISKIKMMDAIFDDDVKVYINVGRYDYQKGHDKLIDAFEKLYEHNNQVFLILVCPHGPLKSKTINRIRNSKAKENVVILGGMNNPYPLLSYCDAFVLSSNFEGLGLVVYEALALNTDVVTVDLKETIQYLEDNQAIIIPNSSEGIYDGLCKHVNNQYKKIEFDFEPFREKSKLEFDSVFK